MTTSTRKGPWPEAYDHNASAGCYEMLLRPSAVAAGGTDGWSAGDASRYNPAQFRHDA